MEVHTEGPGRVSQVLTIIPKISKGLRPHQTDPSSPSAHSEDIDLESAAPAVRDDVEKRPRWIWHDKTSTNPHHTAKMQQTMAANRSPQTLMTLPNEIQALVLSYLDFRDIIVLRRTSRYWRDFASPDLLRVIHGSQGLHTMLIQHCRTCLAYCPKDTDRIATQRTDQGYPLSSRCISCTIQSKDGTIRAGRRVKLGNDEHYWTCRWCGWPVVGNLYRSQRNAGHSEFHRRCFKKYFSVGVIAWLLLGLVQFCLGVVASALVWWYSRGDISLVVPTAIGFILSLACMFLIVSRDCYKPTYYWSLLAELCVLASWVNPMRVIANQIAQGAAGKAAYATLVFVALSMLFRLINVLGNILLSTGYDRTRHHLPYVSPLRRVINIFMTGLIIYTYPRHVHKRFVPLYSSENPTEELAVV